jgi:hypothetical protein
MRFTSQLRTSVLLLLLLGLLLFLFGIRSRREGTSLINVVRFFSGAFLPERNLTMQDGKNWYSENKEALMDLHRVVLKTSDIRRVEPSTPIQFVLDHKWATPGTRTTYNELTKICESLGIQHIAVSRMGNNPAGLLVSVRYTLSSSGLSVSGGRLLSVAFVPDKLSLSRIYNAPEYVATPLDEDNWYVVDYQEGRK